MASVNKVILVGNLGANSSGANLAEAAHLEGSAGLDYIAVQMSNSTPPKSIEYRLDGKFHRVIKRSWA